MALGAQVGLAGCKARDCLLSRVWGGSDDALGGLDGAFLTAAVAMAPNSLR